MSIRRTVKIGNRLVGDNHPCFVVGEIGINANGSVDIAKDLIDVAQEAGCDAVKFQKRTVDIVYSKEELERPRESPFGHTNGDLKRGLELSLEAYQEIDHYCRMKGIMWFASCWDEDSVDFISQFNPPCYKIASACLTDDNLLRYHKSKGKPVLLSTGMSDLPMIEKAANLLDRNNLVIMHCTSTYPAETDELNLLGIKTLRKYFNATPVGYSGHEIGLYTTFAAAVLEACLIERHITLSRSMWGSDQAVSVEPQGFKRLVTDIRAYEQAKGDGVIKIYPSEIPIMKKLRRIGYSES